MTIIILLKFTIISEFGILKSLYENEGMKSLIDGYKAIEGNDPTIMSRLMKNGFAASGGEVFKPQYQRGAVVMWQMNVAGLRSWQNMRRTKL